MSYHSLSYLQSLPLLSSQVTDSSSLPVAPTRPAFSTACANWPFRFGDLKLSGRFSTAPGTGSWQPEADCFLFDNVLVITMEQEPSKRKLKGSVLLKDVKDVKSVGGTYLSPYFPYSRACRMNSRHRHRGISVGELALLILSILAQILPKFSKCTSRSKSYLC